MNQCDLNDLEYLRRLGHNPTQFLGCPRGNDGKINPQVSTFSTADGSRISVFHIKPVYYETTNGFWRPLSEITDYHGNRVITLNSNWRKASVRYIDWLTKRQAILGQELLLPTPFGMWHNQEIARPVLNVGLTTTTVYPDPSSGATTVDGFITSGYSATMQLAHDDTNGDGASTISPYSNKEILCRALRNASGYYLGRCYFLFDTSAISAGDTISSATLSLYGATFAYSNASSTTYEIVASSPASNNNLVTTDFDNISFTSFASKTFASMSQSAYNDFTLDSNGIANVTKGGISKFGSVTGLDLNVSSMTSGHDNIMSVHESDYTGTTRDPKLVVEHTASGGSTFVPRAIII